MIIRPVKALSCSDPPKNDRGAYRDTYSMYQPRWPKRLPSLPLLEASCDCWIERDSAGRQRDSKKTAANNPSFASNPLLVIVARHHLCCKLPASLHRPFDPDIWHQLITLRHAAAPAPARAQPDLEAHQFSALVLVLVLDLPL